MKKFIVILCALCLQSAFASNYTEYHISIEDHKFIPDIITVPAGKKVRLIVTNKDNTPEEFESIELRREKIIGPGKAAKISLGALKAGKTYNFFGEFHEETAQGKILVE